MALVAHSITHMKVDIGPELGQQTGQLIVPGLGLRVDFGRLCKPLEIGAKLGTLTGST